MNPGKLLLVMLLWALYAAMLIRALVKKQGDQQSRLLVWTMLFFVCVAFTFSGREIELYLDPSFGGFPVTLYIKFFSLTQLAHFYYLITQAVYPAPSQRIQWLQWLGPLTIMGGIVSFGLLVLLDVRNQSDIRYYVNAVRDIIIVLYMVVGIIPTNHYMWHKETVPTMRVKHVLNSLLCYTYLLLALSSLISVVVVAFELAEIEALLPLFLPLTYICYFFVLTAMVPHRWIAVFLIPARLQTYFRLRRLQQEVARLAEVHTDNGRGDLNLLAFDNLELAIYQSIIFILDHFTLIKPATDGNPLYNRLSAVLHSDLSYTALVEEMAALGDD
jgi:hypothetical protein